MASPHSACFVLISFLFCGSAGALNDEEQTLTLQCDVKGKVIEFCASTTFGKEKGLVKLWLLMVLKRIRIILQLFGSSLFQKSPGAMAALVEMPPVPTFVATESEVHHLAVYCGGVSPDNGEAGWNMRLWVPAYLKNRSKRHKRREWKARNKFLVLEQKRARALKLSLFFGVGISIVKKAKKKLSRKADAASGSSVIDSEERGRRLLYGFMIIICD